LKQRGHQRPGGAAAAEGGLDARARPGRRLEGLAGGRPPARAASLV